MTAIATSRCIALSALLLASWTSVAFSQERTLYKVDPNNPLDRKAIIGLARAAKAARLDTRSIRLATTDEFNAFYCGQGLFVAGKPLLNLPQWAVDAVMAHEVGHMVSRHVETKAALSTGVIAGLGILGALVDQQNAQEGARADAQLGQTVVSFLAPKYTQGQELQADAYAVRALRAAGYKQPGDTMAQALALIERNTGPSGGGFFDTHPSFEDRIRKLRGK